MSRFPSHNKTKADMTNYLAVKTLEYNSTSHKLVITSSSGLTKSNKDLLFQDNNHEEADTLLIYQAVLASQRNPPDAHMVFFFPDTDVLVLVIANCDLMLKNTSISMASGVIWIESIWRAIGPEKAKDLPAFHAFTGDHNTGRFSRIGKSTWLQLKGWMQEPASKGCEFPSRWKGSWFQKGVHPPIRIEKDVFSFKGKCLDSDGHMFFIEDNREKCFRCIVIYEKHPNVLQYRETYCYNYRSLRHACGILTADAPLHSLFRVDAEPVSCKLRGPFTFSYSRGGRGECKHPVSTVDTCTDDSRLLFRFQACADVMGTESSVEELNCLAVWKEGSAHYLVGKMSNKKNHNLPFTDDNTYRCFVFDYVQDTGDIQMSQSADATCDGLVTPWEGSRTMRLVKSEHPTSRCQVPPWVVTHHKWHTLDGSKNFIFSHKNTTFKLVHSHKDHVDKKFLCIEENSTANSTTLVTYVMSGCENGYVCMKFFKRHDHIIEIQMGNFARTHHEACHSSHTDVYFQEYVTLVASSLQVSSCPHITGTNGFSVQMSKTAFPAETCRDSVSMVVGCRTQDRIEFLARCAALASVKSFHCHGHWEENGRSYLVAGLRNTKSKYCFVYWSNDKTTHLSAIHDTCRRKVELGVTGNFSFNISSAGYCDSLLKSSSTKKIQDSWTTSTFLVLLIAVGFLIR